MAIDYNVFMKLLNHTGFGWDFTSSMPTCPDDVWKEYCKVFYDSLNLFNWFFSAECHFTNLFFFMVQANPKATKFKNIGLQNFGINKLVFEKTNATGD